MSLFLRSMICRTNPCSLEISDQRFCLKPNFFQFLRILLKPMRDTCDNTSGFGLGSSKESTSALAQDSIAIAKLIMSPRWLSIRASCAARERYSSQIGTSTFSLSAFPTLFQAFLVIGVSPIEIHHGLASINYLLRFEQIQSVPMGILGFFPVVAAYGRSISLPAGHCNPITKCSVEIRRVSVYLFVALIVGFPRPLWVFPHRFG